MEVSNSIINKVSTPALWILVLTIALGVMLFLMNLINWRDMLLIITAPIALYYLLFLLVINLTKEESNGSK